MKHHHIDIGLFCFVLHNCCEPILQICAFAMKHLHIVIRLFCFAVHNCCIYCCKQKWATVCICVSLQWNIKCAMKDHHILRLPLLCLKEAIRTARAVQGYIITNCDSQYLLCCTVFIETIGASRGCCCFIRSNQCNQESCAMQHCHTNISCAIQYQHIDWYQFAIASFHKNQSGQANLTLSHFQVALQCMYCIFIRSNQGNLKSRHSIGYCFLHCLKVVIRAT